MKLYLYGHEYKYAVEQMLLTLFPAERPEYPEGAPEGERMEIRLSRGQVHHRQLRAAHGGRALPGPGRGGNER